jgi:polysaccharide export outer membrane protein
VKVFTASETIGKFNEEHKEEMEKEIVKMSQVTENSVFTERNGIPEYIIGSGDLLTINIWEGAKVNSYDCVVRPDGKISYMYLDNITVSGLTSNEAKAFISEALKKYIREPRLEIIVKEFKSKSVLLSGQINVLQTGTSGPGKYPIKQKTTILDLIVMAGGPITGRGGQVTSQQTVIMGQEGGNADLKNVELIRKGKRFTLNLYNVMFKGDSYQNIIIDNGDIITIPELPVFGERIYVFGEINSPGIFRLKDGADLLSSISIAGGPTRVAVKPDIKIIRGYKERQGKPIILSANLDAILKQGDLAQNIKLLDGDVVYVPRRVIGDINEFIINTIPLLDYLLTYPRQYTDAYFKDPANKLRY